MELRKVLENNKNHLITVVIDIVRWSQAKTLWSSNAPDSDNFFAWQILRLRRDTNKAMFPALTKLFLGTISFFSAPYEMVYAFNIGNLKSLKLHRCICTEEFFLAAVESGQEIRLNSLEIVIRSSYAEVEYDVEWLVGFLGRFEGLR